MQSLLNKKSEPSQSATKQPDDKLMPSSKIQDYESFKKAKSGSTQYVNGAALKVVGKRSIIYTKNSNFMRVYLSNDERTYRVIVWKKKICETLEAWKVNNIVKIPKFYVDQFYKPEDVLPQQHDLWKGGDLIFADFSIVSVVSEGEFEEYPAVNNYPPYWRMFEQIKAYEYDIAMRVIVLELPTEAEFEMEVRDMGTKKISGVCFFVGDRKGKKAKLFVGLDKSDESELAELQKWKKDAELIFFGGVPKDNGGKLAIGVFDSIYVESVSGTLAKESSYAAVVFPTAMKPPAPKKKRQSFVM